jgi:hypothetical protein
MSRENVELVRGYWEVVGDMGAFDPIHPEAEWKPVLTSNAALAGSVTCFSLLVSDPGQSGRERSGGGLRPLDCSGRLSPPRLLIVSNARADSDKRVHSAIALTSAGGWACRSAAGSLTSGFGGPCS